MSSLNSSLSNIPEIYSGYCQFASGLMICWGDSGSIEYNIDNQQTSIYWGDTLTYKFAKSFSSAPSVSVGFSMSGSSLAFAEIRSISTSDFSSRLWRPSSATVTGTIYYHAIGFYK